MKYVKMIFLSLCVFVFLTPALSISAPSGSVKISPPTVQPRYGIMSSVSGTAPPQATTNLATAQYVYDPICPAGYMQVGYTNPQYNIVPRNRVETPASAEDVKFYLANGWSCPTTNLGGRYICIPFTGNASQPSPPVGLFTGQPIYDPGYAQPVIYSYSGPGNCYSDQYCWAPTQTSCRAYVGGGYYGYPNNIIFYYTAAGYSSCTCNQNACYSPQRTPSSVICQRDTPQWRSK